MHLLSPIFTVASISSVALHCHVDHLHSFCSNIYSHSSNKPGTTGEGAQQGGGSEGGDDEGLQPRNSTGTHCCRTRKKKVKELFLDILISPIQAGLLPGDIALLASCQHLPIPHSTWTTPDISADKQCLFSSITLSVVALVSLYLSCTMSSNTHIFYLTLQNKTKPEH